MITDQSDEIDRETDDGQENDLQIENALQIDDDDEAGIEITVTGEMIPETGFVAAARALLTHTREAEVKIIATRHQVRVQTRRATM